VPPTGWPLPHRSGLSNSPTPHALRLKADREVPRISHLLPHNRHLPVRCIHLLVPADHLPTSVRVGERGADTGPLATAGWTYSGSARARPADVIEARCLALAAFAAAPRQRDR